MQMSESGRPRPRDVSVYTRSRQVAVIWSDEHASSYDWEMLRWNCPCAVCQGEMGSPGVLQFTSELKVDQTTLVDLQPVGQYALQPIWQDGHDTGIYSFDLLRRLCTCDACAAARAGNRQG